MLVLVTYTIYRGIEVLDDASDSDIALACTAEAPCDYDEVTWAEVDFSENRSKIDSEAQFIVKAE